MQNQTEEMNMENTDKGMQATKIELGEKIVFEDFLIKPVFTSYGETAIISFADDSGKIFKKVWASNGLTEFLKENKDNKSVTLKKVLTEGKYKYNIYE